MPLQPTRLDNVALEYTSSADVNVALDLIGICSAANSGKTAKATIDILIQAINASTTQKAYYADATLAAADLTPVLTNYLAPGAVKLTLPPATVGLFFDAARLTNASLKVKPYGGESFIGGDPGGYLEVIDYGVVQGFCFVAGQWTIYAESHANVWRLENGYQGVDKHLGWYNIVSYGADPTGVADSTAAVNAAHIAAENATPKGLVVAPIGKYKLASTVTLRASMHGLGGNGYTANFARAVFVPTITDGTAALKGTALSGFDFRNFAVDPAIGSPNPNPSGGNVQNCIGLQLGNCAALAATISLPSTTTALITTKYLHTFATGDSVVISNVSGLTGGALNFNGGTYTVTRVSATQFTVVTTGRVADNSVWSAYSSGGLIYPSDLGASKACTRGRIKDVSVSSCNVNFHIQGWLNDVGPLMSVNGTLGFDGSYLNTSTLWLCTEQTWQAFQLLGCNVTNIVCLEDEGAGANNMGAPSTIDYSAYVTCQSYSGEGTRTTGPWMTWGGVSYCRDIHFPYGFAYAGAGGGVSVAVNLVNRFTLPVCLGGYSTTASTTSMKGTATLVAGTKTITFPTTQDDANFFVFLTGAANETFKVTAKATTGFVITSSNGASTTTVDWFVVRA